MLEWDKYKVGILAICLTNVILHLICIGNLEFHRDELLYFSIGLHPQFGYASIPPLTGWVATVVQFFFGFTLFSAKVFPACLSGGFTLVAILITKELGGRTYAQLLTGVAILIMPVTLRAFHLFQPVCIDLFLWTLLFYFSIRFVNTQRDKYLFIIGLTSGIALLNKYLVALLLISLLLSITLSSHRKIYTKRSFYVGILLCIGIFLPNLIWQIVNGLPVISHMNELNESQLVHVNRINFVIDQFTMAFAAGFMLVIGLISLARSKQYRYLAICSCLVFGIPFWKGC